MSMPSSSRSTVSIPRRMSSDSEQPRAFARRESAAATGFGTFTVFRIDATIAYYHPVIPRSTLVGRRLGPRPPLSPVLGPQTSATSSVSMRIESRFIIFCRPKRETPRSSAARVWLPSVRRRATRTRSASSASRRRRRFKPSARAASLLFGFWTSGVRCSTLDQRRRRARARAALRFRAGARCRATNTPRARRKRRATGARDARRRARARNAAPGCGTSPLRSRSDGTRTLITFRRYNRSSRKRPSFTSFSRSRWVAPMTRTSTRRTVSEPTGRISPSWSARKSLACMPRLISAISSRRSVPWCATSKSPARGRTAPVNAPRT